MIKVILENGKADVEIQHDKSVMEQDEIVQLMTVLLFSFRQRAMKTGHSMKEINSDVQTIVNKVINSYNRIGLEQVSMSQTSKQEGRTFGKNIAASGSYSQMDEIMQQIDEMLNNKNGILPS